MSIWTVNYLILFGFKNQWQYCSVGLSSCLGALTQSRNAILNRSSDNPHLLRLWFCWKQSQNMSELWMNPNCTYAPGRHLAHSLPGSKLELLRSKAISRGGGGDSSATPARTSLCTASLAGAEVGGFPNLLVPKFRDLSPLLFYPAPNGNAQAEGWKEEGGHIHDLFCHYSLSSYFS